MSVWPTKKQSQLLGLVCLLIAAMLGLWGYRLFVPSVAQFRRNCLQAAAADEWNSVELNARRWTHIAPGSGEPWMQLGNALARQRKFQVIVIAAAHRFCELAVGEQSTAGIDALLRVAERQVMPFGFKRNWQLVARRFSDDAL